nr:hypothetical protein [Tanacetum cinerariifolium]
MEEIDLSFTLNYPMPPGIEEDDYDSERDILILKELLSIFPEIEDSCRRILSSSLHFISFIMESSKEDSSQFLAPLLGSKRSHQPGNNPAVQVRVVRSYNYQGEVHMARQCTQPKKPRNSASFKEKLLLVQAHEAGQVLE